jgi:hypothetical protein
MVSGSITANFGSPSVDCKQTAVVLFIGQDWKKFSAECNFYFSALAEVQSRQVLHRLHWDNSLMFLEINFNGWTQAVDPGFIWKFAGMASRAYGKLLTHVVFH